MPKKQTEIERSASIVRLDCKRLVEHTEKSCDTPPSLGWIFMLLAEMGNPSEWNEDHQDIEP